MPTAKGTKTYKELSKESRQMIARVMRFFRKEFTTIKDNTICDIDYFRPIKKRVTKASGIGLLVLSRIMREEKGSKQQSKGSQIICEEDYDIIFGLRSLFQEDYKERAKKHHMTCCLSFFDDITKWIAAATGISEYDVTAILQEERLTETNSSHKELLCKIADVKTELTAEVKTEADAEVGVDEEHVDEEMKTELEAEGGIEVVKTETEVKEEEYFSSYF